MRASLLAALLASMASAHLHAEDIRYRGDFTFGHEVNVFCPEISSQCYWLSGDTAAEARGVLESIAGAAAAQPGYEPYDSVCVVLAGSIDRESLRTGFAADYDGLITVSRVFGACDATAVLAEGDLQHHRWVLARIDGNNALVISAKPPELEFGEGMHLSGYAGCNRFTGRGELHEELLRVDGLALTMMACGSAASELERAIVAVLSGEPTIRLAADRSLLLGLEGLTLRFRLRDWMK